jgi:glycosyltransferase involved in cell wall biosynthesis
MKTIIFICNRYTANQDIIKKGFGRQIGLANGLINLGYNVVLYCADYKKKEYINTEYNGIKIISRPLNLIFLLGYAFQLYKYTKKLNPDIVIGSSIPLWGTVGFIVSNLIHKKFIYDIQDNYEIPDKSTFGYIGILLHKLNLLFNNNLIVVSENILKRYKNDNRNIRFIPNSINLKLFKPLNKKKSREKWKFDKNIKYIGYCGSIAKNRGIAELQEAFLILSTKRKDIKLILAGGINDQNIILNKNIIYLGNIDPNKVPSLINALDLVVIPNPENSFTKYCFPYKVLETMACNQNFIMGKTGALSSFNLDKDYYFSNPNNINLLSIEIDKQLSHENNTNTREIASKYTENKIAQELDKFIKSVLIKKIAIICDNVDDEKRTGTANYALNLVNNLQDNHEIEYIIVHKKYIKNLFKGVRKELIVPNKNHSFIFSTIRKVIIMPIKLMQSKVNLVHETYQMGPFILPFLPFKKIVTIHDIFFKTHPNTHNILSKVRHTLSLPIILKNVDMVITDSISSKKDIMTHYKYPKNKIIVNYLGTNDEYKKIENIQELDRIRNKYNLPQNFILSVSTVEPRKNVLTILNSIKYLRDKDNIVNYIIVGKKTQPYFNKLNTYIKENQLGSQVKFLDYVELLDLPYIYNLADLFILPSFYEGFGLPIAEAMSCGCPVITSNLSSLPEIVGNSSFLINPSDIEGISEAIEKLYKNKPMRDSYSKKVLERSKIFNWEDCAKNTENIYKKILNENL